MKKAFITGVLGQDGAYLAKALLHRGYTVLGGVRRTSSINPWRLEYLGVRDQVEIVQLDLLEQSNVDRTIRRLQPDVVFNLAAQSFVSSAFEEPVYTSMVNGMGVLYLLEAIRNHSPATRFYQASTSEMYGQVAEIPQSESTPFRPRSPYGVAKLYGHWITVNYREAHGLHTTCGLLFNHESPLRGLDFVTRKITHGLARIRCGLQSQLQLGNLDARRDWGHAADYVEAMIAMTEQETGGSYVVATGLDHSVRDFLTLALDALGFTVRWEGEAEAERCVDAATGQPIVTINPRYYRPAEVDRLVGDATRARQSLGWYPKISFTELVDAMAQADYDRARKAAAGVAHAGLVKNANVV